MGLGKVTGKDVAAHLRIYDAQPRGILRAAEPPHPFLSEARVISTIVLDTGRVLGLQYKRPRGVELPVYQSRDTACMIDENVSSVKIAMTEDATPVCGRGQAVEDGWQFFYEAIKHGVCARSVGILSDVYEVGCASLLDEGVYILFQGVEHTRGRSRQARSEQWNDVYDVIADKRRADALRYLHVVQLQHHFRGRTNERLLGKMSKSEYGSYICKYRADSPSRKMADRRKYSANSPLGASP